MNSPNSQILQAKAKNNHSANTFALLKLLSSYITLSKLLRLIGAGVLISAIYIFLLQDWHSSNDMSRAVIMLIQTLVLALAGLLCSYALSESKGARLFLGLSLFSVPVNFAILGGLLYSQLQWDGELSHYPAYASWVSDSLGAAVLTTAIGWLLLIPVTGIGFMVLARKSALRLSMLFLLLNATILIPLRSPEWVSGLLVVLTMVILQQLSTKLRGDSALQTLEGRMARFMLWLPLTVIMGRTVYLYTADILLFLVISVLMYGIFRHIAMDKGFSFNVRRLMEYLGILAASCMALGLALLVDNYHPISGELFILIFTLSFAGLSLEISVRACQNGAGYRRLAAMITVSGMFINLFLFPGTMTASISLFTGIALLIYSCTIKQRVIFILGLCNMLIGLSYHIKTVMAVFDLGSWVVLSLLGMAIILIASVLERYGLLIRSKWTHWQRHFKSWQY